jgi:hypothetical protein
MYNPFGMGSARQQGFNQNPYDFKGLESRLGKIETGIAGLTEQFGNFQMPGQETVDPVYTGNTAPNPLTPAVPTGGISSLPEEETPAPVAPQGPQQPTSMADWVRDYEFDMAPQISASEWDEWESTQPQVQYQQGQGGFYGGQQGRQNFMENWQENNPEYQAWKEREAGRDPLSQETKNVMTMGFNPLGGGQGIIPSIQEGKSYEDYMGMVNEAQDAWAGTQWDQYQAGIGSGITGLAGHQQQRTNAMLQSPSNLTSFRQIVSPGNPDYTPLTAEQYGGQQDLWKDRQQFDALMGATQKHLGGSGMGLEGRGGMFRGLGIGGSGMGRAYEAWNQFNQSQEGGPYTAEAPQYGQQVQTPAPQQEFTNNLGSNALSTTLMAGLGALKGPTQQLIQGYMT